MRILITGANGFVGKRLQQKLNKSNHDIVLLTKQEGFDITDMEGLLKLPKVDVIVHLAAKSYVPDSYNEPLSFFETNVQGTNNMLEIARRDNAKFIFISSYVYGNPEKLPTPEDHKIVAANPYAASKIMGEDLCNYYNNFFNVGSIILRPFNLYGPGQNEIFLIPKLVKQSKEGKVTLFNPKPRRDFVHVDDFATAIINAIDYKKPLTNNLVLNVGSGTSYSVEELVELIKKNSNNPFTIEYLSSDRPTEIMETTANISNIDKELNWKPSIAFEDGIISLLN